MKRGVYLLVSMGLFLLVRPSRADMMDQNQPSDAAGLAGFSQGDLAQSFEQSANNITRAGIFIQASPGAGTGNITIDLYDHLPNAAKRCLGLVSGFSSFLSRSSISEIGSISTC